METFSMLMDVCAGNSPGTGEFPAHTGQWCRTLMFSLICAWINSWVNNREAGDLRCHHGLYDVTVMQWKDDPVESSPSGKGTQLYSNVMVRWVQFCDVTYIVFRVREPYRWVSSGETFSYLVSSGSRETYDALMSLLAVPVDVTCCGK